MKKYGFGKMLRDARLQRGFSLRQFAEKLDVSSTYLSQVERGHFAPLTASKAARAAKLLGEDADYWIGLAGRIPEDLEPIIRRHPTTMPDLIRLAGQLPDEEITEALFELRDRLNASRTLVEA
jgi:transcriptional regulator with XRE-family HTH domain